MNLREPSPLRGWIFLGVLATLIVGFVVGVQLLYEGEPRGLGELREGDCIRFPDDDEFRTVTSVDCGSPHDGEVTSEIAKVPLPQELTPSVFPEFLRPDDPLMARLVLHCTGQASRYLGGAIPDDLRPEVLYEVDDGEPDVVCVLVAADGAELLAPVRS